MGRITAFVLLLLVLSGCAAGAGNDYLSLSPHSGAQTQTADADAVTVENYQELKSAILGFVRESQENGTIHVYSYDGDVETELGQAAYEVAKLDPLGAYAVDYMTHECVRIVSYYEIHISITFRRSGREIAAIRPASTTTQMVALLNEAIDQYQSRLTVRVGSYEDPDIPALVSDYCAEHPETVMEVPAVDVSTYPEEGTVRIVEINFTYTQSAQALQEKAKAVGESIDAAAEYIRYRDTDWSKAELLFTYLMERFTYTAGETATPLYDALCSGIATPLGLSQAWQLICDRAGVDCYTVTGLRNDEPYTWNIVSADGYYRHLDLQRCVLETGSLALWDDQAMGTYYWNAENYPACQPQPEPPVVQPEPEPEPEAPPEEADPTESAEEPLPEEPAA